MLELHSIVLGEHELYSVIRAAGWGGGYRNTSVEFLGQRMVVILHDSSSASVGAVTLFAPLDVFLLVGILTANAFVLPQLTHSHFVFAVRAHNNASKATPRSPLLASLAIVSLNSSP